MNKTGICLFFFLTICASAFSQNNYLKAGDAMPDYEFKHVYNNNGKPVKISDFNGKLLILDFWSTSCQSCIESWPKLNKLQTKYGDRIKILLVNAWQDSLKVSTAYKKWESVNRAKMVLPSVYSDRAILDFFEIAGVPYVVWVDQAGKVHSITYSDVLNERTIDSFLAGTPRVLRQIVDKRYKLRLTEPLYVNGNGGGATVEDSHVLWQSVVGTYSPMMGPNGYIVSRDTLSFVSYTNCLVVDMIRFILDSRMYNGFISLIPNSRVELRVPNRKRYIGVVDGETAYENYYAYHLWTKRKVPTDILKAYALDDIKRVFGIDFWWEKQTKQCLVLTSSDTTQLLYDGSATTSVVRAYEAEWSNVTLDFVLFHLVATGEYFNSTYPLINETGYKGVVKPIRAKCVIADHNALDRELSKYGLRFTLQEREVDVLVITEKEPTDQLLTRYDFNKH